MLGGKGRGDFCPEVLGRMARERRLVSLWPLALLICSIAEYYIAHIAFFFTWTCMHAFTYLSHLVRWIDFRHRASNELLLAEPRNCNVEDFRLRDLTV